jgi:anti-sigma B factor antagonist
MSALMGGGSFPANTSGFDVEENWIEQVVVLTVSGEVDLRTAPRLDEAIHAAARKEPCALIVDLTRVEFLASAGMNLLLAAHREITPSARFGVIAHGPATGRPLTMTGIDNVVPVHKTLGDALAPRMCGPATSDRNDSHCIDSHCARCLQAAPLVGEPTSILWLPLDNDCTLIICPDCITPEEQQLLDEL